MPEENTLPVAGAIPVPKATMPGDVQTPAVPSSGPADGGTGETVPAAATGAPLPPHATSEPSPGVQTVPLSPGASEPASHLHAPPLPPVDPPQTAVDPAAPTAVPAMPAFPPPISSSSPELTSIAGMPSPPPGEMSVKDMFLHADPVVQGVMLLLLLASLATWVIIFEKTLILRRVSRNIMLFKRSSAKDSSEVLENEFPPLTHTLVKAGIRESGDAAGNETRSDYRERVERSMRAELSGFMDRIGYRVLFLATVGAVSPFVGLFGTVWGIMHSFVGIAASGETTLAVVAPGIAEALFATAMGLVAAIPAVIAYNKITGTMKKITKEALAGIGFLGNRLARKHFGGLSAEGGQWTPGN